MNKEEQILRHALGLSDYVHSSFRNHYSAVSGHTNYTLLLKLTEEGYMLHHNNHQVGSYFTATFKGAMSVLRSGESLCIEDFPEFLKTFSLTEDQITLLNCYTSEDIGFGFNFEVLYFKTGFSRKRIRENIRILASYNLLKYERCCFNDEGMICGAAYTLTSFGHKYLRKKLWKLNQ